MLCLFLHAILLLISLVHQSSNSYCLGRRTCGWSEFVPSPSAVSPAGAEGPVAEACRLSACSSDPIRQFRDDSLWLAVHPEHLQLGFGAQVPISDQCLLISSTLILSPLLRLASFLVLTSLLLLLFFLIVIFLNPENADHLGLPPPGRTPGGRDPRYWFSLEPSCSCLSGGPCR